MFLSSLELLERNLTERRVGTSRMKTKSIRLKRNSFSDRNLLFFVRRISSAIFLPRGERNWFRRKRLKSTSRQWWVNPCIEAGHHGKRSSNFSMVNPNRSRQICPNLLDGNTLWSLYGIKYATHLVLQEEGECQIQFCDELIFQYR